MAWTVQYEADVVPSSATPAWTDQGSITTEEILSGKLHAVWNTGVQGSWEMETIGFTQSAGYTMEFSMQVTSTDDDTLTIAWDDDNDYCELFISESDIEIDGAYLAEATQTYSMDTTDAYHTYRVVVKNSTVTVYVDGTSRITGTLNDAGGGSGGDIYWGAVATPVVSATEIYVDYFYYNLQDIHPYANSNKITIDNTKVEGSANFTDFPLLFSGAYDGTDGEPDLRTAANGGDVQNADAAGGIDGATTVPADLAFFSDDSASVRYDHEIVRYNASTGEIVAYVRIPTLKYDTDTELYLYYGNSTVTTSRESIDGTWASAYKGVWHMDGSSKDSSGNSQDGSDTDITYATSSGNIGQGAESPGGAGDNIDVGNNSIFDWTSEDFTIAFWAYMTSTTNGEIILTRGDYNNDGYYVAYRYSAPNWGLEMYTSQSSAFQRTQTLYDCNLNTWYRIVINRSGTDVDIWQNGTEFNYASNGTHTDPATNSRNLYMFAYDAGVLPIPGYLDEVMMVEEYWGDDRIKTDYNSQNSPSTFYSIEAGSSTIQSMGFGDEGFVGS